MSSIEVDKWNTGLLLCVEDGGCFNSGPMVDGYLRKQ